MRSTLRVLTVFGALAVACVVAGHVDVAEMGGGFKGDEATYIGLAASAGFDRDLTYGPQDYQRFRKWYGGGPQGIFLKRGMDGQLYYGKAFLYGVLAAPFALAGGPGGLLVFNFTCFALLLSAGYLWLRPGSRHTAALAFTLAFLAASIAPLYAFWLTSDALNFALVFIAFACAVAPPGEPLRPLQWRALGFVLLAASVFSKPLNLPLALPLAMAAGKGGLVPTARALAAIGAAVVVFFAINAGITGELNYQGGDRKTFYGTFPYDEGGTTFDSAGISLATDSLTPAGARRSSRIACGKHPVFRPGPPFWSAPIWLALARRGRLVDRWRSPKDAVAVGAPGRNRRGGARNDRVDAVYVVGRWRTRREPVLPERRGRVIFPGPAGAVIRSGCSRSAGPGVCVAVTLQPIYGRQAAVAGHAGGNLRGASARADGCIGLSGHPRSAAKPHSARTRAHAVCCAARRPKRDGSAWLDCCAAGRDVEPAGAVAATAGRSDRRREIVLGVRGWIGVQQGQPTRFARTRRSTGSRDAALAGLFAG